MITEIHQALSHWVVTAWLTGGRIRQSVWENIVQVTGDDVSTLYIAVSFMIVSSTYWLVGSLYIAMDICNKPDALRKYKIQPGTHETVDKLNLLKAILTVLFNQTAVSCSVAYALRPLFVWRGFPDVHDLPPIQTVVFQIFLCVIFEELGFYYSHRMLHHPLLYKYIHKKHHEWTAPVAVVAMYSHPIEHVLANMFPPYLGVFITGAHVSVAWTWFCLATIYTLNEHSGYHLPFFPSAEYHDFHHLKFSNNFGVLGLLDYLHGTDISFKKNVASKRHKTLFTLQSAREKYPDHEKAL